MERPRTRTTAAAALAWAMALPSCEPPASTAVPGSSEPAPEPDLSRLGPIRRPEFGYRMIRTGERCEVVIEKSGEEGERSPTKSSSDSPGKRGEFACPRDLLLGEWIRLTGMTCLREGGPPERKVPVVCPDYLTNAARDHRAR